MTSTSGTKIVGLTGESCKQCTQCGEVRELSLFNKNKRVKRDGKTAKCKSCISANFKKNYREDPEKYLSRAENYKNNNLEKHKERSKKYYHRTKEKDKLRKQDPRVKAQIKDRNLRKTYGITLEDYNGMFIKQEGRCFCCVVHQVELTKSLFVDHNHSTGKVRGLLCHSCNAAIGLVGEDIEVLKNIIGYLETHNDGN